MQKVIFEQNPEMTDEELEAVVGGALISTGVAIWIIAAAASAA